MFKYLVVSIAAILSFDSAYANQFPPTLSFPNCDVILNGELQLNTNEDQQKVKHFFSLLQLAIDEKNKDKFLALTNFSGATAAQKSKLEEEFIQPFFDTDNSIIIRIEVVDCINTLIAQELAQSGVSLTSNGLQVFTTTEGVTYRSNHPAFYNINLVQISKVETESEILSGYGFWAGPYNDKIMFNVDIPDAN